MSQYFRYFISGGVFLFPFAALAFPVRNPELQVINTKTRQVIENRLVFDRNYKGGVEIAVGDLGTDGQEEIVVAQSGGESEGIIKVYRQDGSLINFWHAFNEIVEQTELDLAVGDVDGDGAGEIVVSLPQGVTSNIHIYSGAGKLKAEVNAVFEAFPKTMRGVSVAVGNVFGDQAQEIIVGTGAGAVPKIRVYNSKGKMVTTEFTPFNEQDTYGLNLAAINTDGGEYDELVVGFLNGGATWIKNYKVEETKQTVLAEFQVWTKEFDSGVNLAAWDLDGDGKEEIAVVPAGDQRAEVKVFRGDGLAVSIDSFWLWEEDFRGGTQIAFVDLNNDFSSEMLVVPRLQRQRGDLARGSKYIETNLTKQTTYLWEDGYLRNAYLISSGLPSTPSPEGEHKIYTKIETHTYDGRPYYYFPNTKWNLRYIQAGPGRNMYYHTAYWHNDFGRPKSHGCINMREADAKFLYFWAEIGTPVWIHK